MLRRTTAPFRLALPVLPNPLQGNPTSPLAGGKLMTTTRILIQVPSETSLTVSLRQAQLRVCHSTTPLNTWKDSATTSAKKRYRFDFVNEIIAFLTAQCRVDARSTPLSIPVVQPRSPHNSIAANYCCSAFGPHFVDIYIFIYIYMI